MGVTLQLALFELHNVPSKDDFDAVKEVWDAGTFPWEWCVQHNTRASGGKPRLQIGFKDKDGSLGYFNPSTNFINVDPIAAHQGGLRGFRETLTHELTHLVDWSILSSESRIAIHKLMHKGSHETYEACLARADAGEGRRWPESTAWRVGSHHQLRASEAFANLLPKVWCPEYSKLDNRYGPHYFNTRDEVWEIVMADTEDEYPFTDVEGTTHEEAILWAVRNGVASGFPDGTYRPNEPVTRGQVAAMIRNYDSGRP